MIKNIFLYIFIMYNISLTGQEEDQYSTDGWSLGFVPSAILNVWPAVQMKAEYGFLQNFAISANLGYLNGFRSKGNYLGIRIRPSIRYYFDATDYPDNRPYLELGYLHRNHNLNTEGTASISNGVFFQELQYTKNIKLKGPYIMFGVKTPLEEQFWLEGGFGLGLGNLNVTNNGLPQDAEIIVSISESLFQPFIDSGVRNLTIIILHLSFGMKF